MCNGQRLLRLQRQIDVIITVRVGQPRLERDDETRTFEFFEIRFLRGKVHAGYRIRNRGHINLTSTTDIYYTAIAGNGCITLIIGMLWYPILRRENNNNNNIVSLVGENVCSSGPGALRPHEGGSCVPRRRTQRRRAPQLEFLL